MQLSPLESMNPLKTKNHALAPYHGGFAMYKWIGFLLCSLFSGYCSASYVISFPENPCLIPTFNHRWLLCQDMHIYVDSMPVIIPKGFNTDLASIPKIFWSFDSPFEFETIPPAILHDYLYFNPSGFSRYEADVIFYDALIVNGVSFWRANLYYYTVRSFGWRFFNPNKVSNGSKDIPRK